MEKVDRNTRILQDYIVYLKEQAALYKNFYQRANTCLKEVEKDKEIMEDMSGGESR